MVEREVTLRERSFGRSPKKVPRKFHVQRNGLRTPWWSSGLPNFSNWLRSLSHIYLFESLCLRMDVQRSKMCWIRFLKFSKIIINNINTLDVNQKFVRPQGIRFSRQIALIQEHSMTLSTCSSEQGWGLSAPFEWNCVTSWCHHVSKRRFDFFLIEPQSSEFETTQIGSFSQWVFFKMVVQKPGKKLIFVLRCDA